MTGDADRQQLLSKAEENSARHPNDAAFFVELSAARMAVGAYDGAADAARRAAELGPHNAFMLRFASGAVAAAGAVDEAAELARRAIALAPLDPEMHLHLAGLLVTLQRWQEAARYIVDHLTGPAASVHSWRLLSHALQHMGRPREAIDAIDLALELAPADATLWLQRGVLRAARGLYPEALDDLATAAGLAPDLAAIWRARSGVAMVTKNLPMALADARRAAGLAPEDPEIGEHLGYLERLGSPTGADPSRPGAARLHWLGEAQEGLRRRPERRQGIGTALAVQMRVIAALLLRDIRTRYGRTRLGYFWGLLEPIAHLVTLGTVFSLMNTHPPLYGESMYLFYCTGLLPYLLFSHVAHDMSTVLHGSSVMLRIPLVKQVDLVVARALLYLASETLVGILVFLGFGLLGYRVVPVDLLTCMQAVLATWFLALGIGTCNIVLSEFLRFWETITLAMMRLLYFGSGIYYAALTMPANVRTVLSWNPLLQSIEWFRAGFYQGYDAHWLDRTYVLIWAACALVLGFSLLRVFRRQLETIA